MSLRYALTVVHRDGDHERELGTLPSDFRNTRSLDPFISVLLRDGITTGTVVLVDGETGKDIVARSITPFGYHRPRISPPTD